MMIINMKKLRMKEITGLVLAALLLVPTATLAQAEAITEPVTAPVIAESTPVEPTVEPAIEPMVDPVSEPEPEPAVEPASEPQVADAVEQSPVESTEAVQETANTQEMIQSDVLEDTANPEMQPTDELTVTEIVEATSTVEVIEVIATPETPEVPVEEVLIEEPVLDVVAESLPIEAAPEPVRMDEVQKDIVEMKVDVDPTYVIELSGQTIPAKKKGIIGTTDLTASAATSVDSETGVLTVSGACSSAYFVVLIFKNQTDYEVDPRSFIVNRAYPCENGSYSYSIDRLPPTLANGMYYLMIGEQGERGAWTPATGLTEIAINRNN